MKSSYLRPVWALALALSLAACGGKATFTIGGAVNGLTYDGLVLTTNGGDLAVKGKDTTFSFPNTIDYGSTYAVTVKTQPAHETCTVANGADTAGRLATIQVTVTCVLNANAISGTVTGLTADNLQLINGSGGGIVTVLMASPTFAFPAVNFGDSYGVTVFKQPDGNTQTCSVSPNGTGVMGDVPVTDIVVSCAPK